MIDQLSATDIVTIVLSLLAVAGAGLLGARRVVSNETSSYVLAGRSLTLPVFVGSLVATWYGSVLGATEFIVSYGVAFLLCFGVPYYVIAIFYAQWLARRIRQSDAISIPDQFHRTYGSSAARVIAAMMLIITIPASYQLSLALVTQTLTGWTLGYSLVLSSAVSFLYIAKGGLRSDAYANVIQVGLMFVGYASLIVVCANQIGTLDWLVATTPKSLLTLPGPLGWTPIIVWGVIAFQTFIDPNFHVRAAAASTASTARRGILMSVGLWIVFDLMQLLVGLYTLSSLGPEYSVGAQSALQLAISIMPDLWRGIFLAGIIAAIMSTLDGYALVSGTTIGYDLLRRRGEHVASVTWVRLGTAISLVIGGVVAYAMPSVVELLYSAASIAVPAILGPLLVSYTRRAQYLRHRIIPAIIVPATASFLTMVLRPWLATSSMFAEPMIVGILVSAVILAISLRVQPRATST